MTCLDYWQGHGFQVLWVHLTTAVGGDGRLLAAHHQRLRRVVERRWGFEGIQYAEVLTAEGNGVVHTLWAWRGSRRFFIPQAVLSEEWARIHGAPVVYIEQVRMHDARGLAKYSVTQYMAGGQEALRQVRVSWRSILGVSGVALWAWWKRHYRPDQRGEALINYRNFLRTGAGTVPGVGEVSLLAVRAARMTAYGKGGWLREGVKANENRTKGARRYRLDAESDA